MIVTSTELLEIKLTEALKEIAEQLAKLAETTSLIYGQLQSLEERINIIDERTR